MEWRPSESETVVPDEEDAWSAACHCAIGEIFLAQPVIYSIAEFGIIAAFRKKVAQ